MPELLRGGLVGCGYFARNHLHAWREIPDTDIVAVCDLDTTRARDTARAFGVSAAYEDVETMLRKSRLDFVDVVTQPSSHRPLVESVARYHVPVICQKPLAPSLEDARAMVQACEAAGVPLMVHENFRWQTPLRALKAAATEIGELFFGRISFRSAFDVYAEQPYLATDPRFIVYDLGVHLLDLARFYFGEVAHVYCRTQRVNAAIRGEDVATVVLAMRSGATCVVDMSYASQLERELFPQTLVHLEGTDGSARVSADYWLTVTSRPELHVANARTRRERHPPRSLTWSASPGEAIQDSVLAIQQHWANCLRASRPPETSGRDNLRTLELVFGAYQAAREEQVYVTNHA